MKNLKAPIHINHKQSFIDIINAKKDSIVLNKLKAIEPDVLKRYTDYQSNFKSNSLVKLSDSLFGGDANLLKCYTSGGYKIAAIKKEIKDLQDKFSNEKCMYCQIKDPDSFDHYLPKDRYPEFCALALNLIPCCVTCNKKKDVYWKEGGETGIINFYLDSLPSKQVLFANISFSKHSDKTPSISFQLINKNKVDPKSFKLFERHYERLKLTDRYKEKSDSELSELRRTLNSYGSKLTDDGAMKSTLEYSLQLKKDYGINFWKGILFEELSKQKQFFKNK